MKRLRKLREEKRLRQQALAELFNVTQQSIYKYEHGLAFPDIEIISKMADFFDTSIDYLTGNTEIPCRYETVKDSHLTVSEFRVLEYYRKLSPEVQALIQQIIKKHNVS